MVLVTGASTGIGAACALDLDRRGWHVLAGVRTTEAAERLQGQASAALVPVMLDVTDAESIRAAAEIVAEHAAGAGLAGLVNNAGIVVSGPLEFLPIDDLRRQFEVNVVGQLAVIQAVLPLLRVGAGRIVNVGSVNGRVAPPYMGPYAMSKHALEAMTDSLRIELRQWEIHVSIIQPASVDTPIWNKATAAADDLTERVPEEADQLYGKDLQAMLQAVDRFAREAMPVERATRAVRHALSARRPKTRYPVGVQTAIALFFLNHMPDRLRDWFVKRELGLK
ncbi:MAG: SDR family oxidoreductase [Planctomycetes bacterium]|nr:SDR family oxidoreductase [Planctomycetota bacterium]